MKKTDLVILFLISLGVLVSVALLERVPGYIDADYYYGGGVSLYEGRGFYDAYLWNYLDKPTGLPNASHTYWMPLPSIFSWLGMVVLGKRDFFSARVIFLIIASLIPPLTAWLAYRWSGRRVSGWIAGGLAIFSGYYLIFMGLVETFALTMLGGAVMLILIQSNLQALVKSILMGMLAGGMHLTRADGLLWLGLGGVALVAEKGFRKGQWKQTALMAGGFMAGYLALMGGWYLRNLTTFGGLFPPGNSRVLWMTSYDQMFSFSPEGITPQTWWEAGAEVILHARWTALLSNLQTTLAVQALIFLLPLMLVGLWRLRHQQVIRYAALMWLAFFALMTFVFPLAGSRGGFFHVAAGVQVVFWAAVPVGMEAFIEIGIRHRKWKMERALKGFGFLIVLLACLLSVGLVWSRTVGENPGQPAWGQYWSDYQKIESNLVALGARPGDVVVVNNPPGYYNATQRSAIMIPDGDENVARMAAQKFGAKFLILDSNTNAYLINRYLNPASKDGLTLLTIIGRYQVYHIEP